MAHKHTSKAVSPNNAQRAHRRQMPKLMAKLNDYTRNGRRWFGAGVDFPEPFFYMVYKAMVKAGWEIKEEHKEDYHGMKFRAKNESWIKI